MRGKCPAAARLRDSAKHFALISQRAGPLTASVYALRAAFGGCAPTRACGRSPKGEATQRAKPLVSSSPSIRFMHCTAAPELPLPRLSNRLISCIRVPSGLARQ